MNSFVSSEEHFITPREEVFHLIQTFFITIIFDHPMILKYANTFFFFVLFQQERCFSQHMGLKMISFLLFQGPSEKKILPIPYALLKRNFFRG